MKEFALDMTGILEKRGLQTEDLEGIRESLPTFNSALTGTYSPILKELERMYLEKDSSPENREKLAQDITDYFEHIDPGFLVKDKLQDTYYESCDIDPSKIFYFILNSLNNNLTIQEIMDGYTRGDKHYTGVNDAFGHAFVKDFNRTPVKVVDQNGTVLHENLHTEIYNSLEEKDKNITNYKLKLQEKLNLTDQQMQAYVSRIDQRSASGANARVFFLGKLGMGKGQHLTRQEILTVNQNKEGVIEVQSFASTSTMQLRDPETEDLEPYSTLTTQIYFPKRNENQSIGLNLRSQALQETIIFRADTQDAEITLPPSLLNRTFDYKVSEMLAKDDINKEELDKILENDHLDIGLSRENIILLSHSDLLNEEQRTKLVASFIKKEIDSLKKQNPDISNKEIQTTLQDSINVLGNVSGCTEEHFTAFKKHIGDYLSNGNFKDLSKTAEYTNSIILNKDLQTKSIEQITADALWKDNKTVALLLKTDDLNQYLSRRANLALCQYILLEGQNIDIDPQYKNKVIENFIKDEIDRCCTKKMFAGRALDKEKLKETIQTLTGLEQNSEKLDIFIAGAESYVKEKKTSILKTLSAYVRGWFQENQITQGRESPKTVISIDSLREKLSQASNLKKATNAALPDARTPSTDQKVR